MTYDYNGAWSDSTAHNAPLYNSSATTTHAKSNVDSTIKTYLDAGVPPEKIIVGFPYYGRAFKEVGSTNNGLGQPFKGLPMGTWEMDIFDYHDLVDNYLTDANYTRFWDAEGQVPYLYSSSEQIFISYDDSESFQLKIDYILDNNLAGAMFWELSGATNGFELTTLLDDNLRP